MWNRRPGRRRDSSHCAGLKIGLVTNHTGRTRDGKSTIDVLFHAPGVTLAKLFSPEHGIRGEVDAAVPDSKDEATDLPIISLYAKDRRPKAKTSKGSTCAGVRHPGNRHVITLTSPRSA